MWCAGGVQMCQTLAMPVCSGLKLFVLKTEAVYSFESYQFIGPFLSGLYRWSVAVDRLIASHLAAR
jgi:hypothetical protein